jgi:hypothetical protein
MTLDNGSWSEYFDSINVRAERLRAAVTLARVPLPPARAGRHGGRPARGGLLEAIRFNRRLDEIEVAISQNGASGASVRYFVPSPRSVTVEDFSFGKLISITDSDGLSTVISLTSLDHDRGGPRSRAGQIAR